MAKSRATDALQAVREQATAARAAVVAELSPIRSQIEATQDAIAELERSLPTRREVELRLGQVLSALSAGSGHAFAPLLANNPRWPTEPVSACISAIRAQPAAALLAAFLGAQTVREAIMADLDRHAEALGGWPALDAEARKRRLGELRLALKRLERREEEIISAAGQGGIRLDRRDDADPAAVLGLE